MDERVQQVQGLIAAWLGDDLDEAGLAQLQTALRDPRHARDLVRSVHFEIALGRVAAAQRERQRLAAPEVPAPRPTQRHARRRTRRAPVARVGVAAAVAALLALAVGALLAHPGRATVLRVERGLVALSGGQAVPGHDYEVAPGDEVSVPDGGRAGLRYDDGTTVALAGPARVRVGPDRHGKRLELENGDLAAAVAKQPAGAPLVIATPRAVTTVVGTRLRVRSLPLLELVEVGEGRVRSARARDQAQVEVGAGEHADLLAPGALVAHREYAPPQDGLQLRLDADDGPVAGADGLVAAWRERSPRGLVLSQADPALQPRLVPAAGARHALVAFPRPGDGLAVSALWAPFTAFTVAGMLRPHRLAVWGQAFGNGWGRFGFHGEPGGGVFAGVGLEPSPVGGPNRFTPGELPGALVVGTWLRFALVHEPTGMSFYVDGRRRAHLPTTAAPLAWRGFSIGAGRVLGIADSGFAADLAELLVYDRALDEREIALLDLRFQARAEATP